MFQYLMFAFCLVLMGVACSWGRRLTLIPRFAMFTLSVGLAVVARSLIDSDKILIPNLSMGKVLCMIIGTISLCGIVFVITRGRPRGW
ncbi:MAG: hypothetical protein LBI74_10685 [Synergistaceae bacterium]|nr:hypothetical protein [Synergistaceae bacterium]